MSNLQKIRTDKYGDLEVVQSFHEGPRVIHLLKNGCYVFDSGLPVRLESDLRRGLGKGSNFIEDALGWLEHKDDRVNGSIREIKHLHGQLVYADDGSPVNAIEDIIAFFEPGPFREAAFAVYAGMVTGHQEATLAQRPARKPAAAVRRAAAKDKSKGKKAVARKPAVKEPAEQTQAAPAG